MHFAMEQLFQLAPRLFHAGNLRHIALMRRHQFTQHAHIRAAEMLLGAEGLMRVHPQLHQRLAPQFQRAGEGFAAELFYPRLQQLMRLHAAARPRQNAQVRKVLLAQPHDLHGVFRLVAGDHDRLGLLSARRAQQLQLGGIAVINLVAVAPQYANGADVALQNGNAHFVGHQQAADHRRNARSRR